MTGWYPVVGALVGFVLGLTLFGIFRVPPEVASSYAPYLSLATLAALDTTLGDYSSVSTTREPSSDTYSHPWSLAKGRAR